MTKEQDKCQAVEDNHECSPRYLYDKESECPAWDGSETGEMYSAVEKEMNIQVCAECGEEVTN